MGSSTSIRSNKLTPEEFKEICSKQYSYKLLLALQNEQELIDIIVLQLLNDLVEKEVLLLYLSYCDGFMLLGNYIQFCVETKLLSKRLFSRKEAENLFLKYCKNEQINYYILRYQIFPQISIYKEMPLDRLLLKLSVCDGPIVLDQDKDQQQQQNNNENNNNNNNNQQQQEQQQQSRTQTTSSSKNELHIDDKITTFTPEQLQLIRKALTQLQRVWRSSLAAKEIAARREIRRLESTASENIARLGPNIAQAVGPPKTLEEKNCLDLFNRYSNDEGEMSLQDFLNFCHFTGLIPNSSVLISSASTASLKKQFTKLDAQNAFKKTVAMFYDSNTKSYREGVRFGKRIIFAVFRLILLVEIASKKHMDINELLRVLVKVKRRISFGDMDLIEQEEQEQEEKQEE